MATTLSPAENAPATSAPSPERIMQMAWGYAPPLILETAIRHRVFDVLDSGPLSLNEIAQAT
jgi:3-hydroxy-5-methyl-1-naphthoate 3-O-methyltransferase